jgi:hypothetical protein
VNLFKILVIFLVNFVLSVPSFRVENTSFIQNETQTEEGVSSFFEIPKEEIVSELNTPFPKSEKGPIFSFLSGAEKVARWVEAGGAIYYTFCLFPAIEKSLETSLSESFLISIWRISRSAIFLKWALGLVKSLLSSPEQRKEILNSSFSFAQFFQSSYTVLTMSLSSYLALRQEKYEVKLLWENFKHGFFKW